MPRSTTCRFVFALLFVGLSATAPAAQGVFSTLADRAQLPTEMSAAEAHKKATAGDVLLVDIRRPREWRETGLAASARPITMHQPLRAFLNAVHEAQGFDMNKPVAIICAVGIRTKYMQEQMKRAGFLNVIDISEGMIGGRNGTGWIKTGLPVVQWTPMAAEIQAPRKLFPRGSFAN